MRLNLVRRNVIKTFLVLTISVGALGWLLTGASPLPSDGFATLDSDATRGEAVFWAAGCASCHVAPGTEEADRPILAGGQSFASPFGTFHAPNISSDPVAGIGSWSVADLGNALLRGVSPKGQHYYPAFPYTAYTHMAPGDVADLHAYLLSLPASSTPSQAHDLGFPFNIRRSVGVWKWLYLRSDWVLQDAPTPELERGRYLVEALGHCAECHTPRTALGGLSQRDWMAGAPNPSGPGRIPAIHPKTLNWSVEEIAYYLETGFTPDFDSAGGHMARVVSNFARLPATDRLAVAAYLKALQ
ncbi:MAG TPA: diacylglycerol kinase [Rhodobacteraceae bacterium]|mgnify:FL=1|jgi:mono/diheme cytochrome c family protein|nr:diacylglycerol kinase [Paracoccaceae bacterium]HBV55252.1 diacylglycerol kinase [Paracoccaceae bacterium]